MAGLLLILMVGCMAPKQGKPGGENLYSVAFYNVENLFDTIHDPGKNDREYLPYAEKKWDTEKYTSKLKNLARVISELARDKTPQGPAVIGLAEVENRFVVHDLINEPALKPAGYEMVHIEGPDVRGIDCALIYDPRQFSLTHAKLAPYQPLNGDTTHKTRGFLMVSGRLAKEKVCVIVNHWPSRGAEAPARIWAAQQVKHLTDSIARKDKQTKIIVMGDMNDDPMDESMAATLKAHKHAADVAKGEFYNPWWEVLEDQQVGTLMYRGRWNLFDQIVLSDKLLGAKKLRYHSHEIFKPDYLFQTDGQYKGSPMRTHGGKLWLNGYSDHLPTIVYLSK